MDFIIGSFVTLFLVTIFNRRLKKYVSKVSKKTTLTQSSIHSRVIIEVAKIFTPKPRKQTQSLKYDHDGLIKMVKIDNDIFWIINTRLHTAKFQNGKIDRDTIKPVDTTDMNSVQLKKIEFIVNKLNEGKEHDDWNSGDK